MSNHNTFHENGIEIGISNETLSFISLIGFTIIFASLALLCHFSPAQEQYDAEEGNHMNNVDYDQLLEDADVSTLNRAQRRARAKLRMKKNRRLGGVETSRRRRMNAEDDGNENEEDDDMNINHNNNRLLIGEHGAEEDNRNDDLDDDERPSQIVSSLSRKERQKAAKEQERLDRREYEKIRQTKIEQETLKREERELLMKEKKEMLERERQEILQNELNSWKFMFYKSDQKNAVTVNDFIQELEIKQVISLDDSATKFNVSVEMLIQRLRQLEEEGRIQHGIVDEQNRKYHLITNDDMNQLREVISAKGILTLEEIGKEVTRILLEKKETVRR